MKKILKGMVWAGYIGEYKKPPVYIIVTPGAEGETIFISDFLRKFVLKKVEITVKVIEKDYFLKHKLNIISLHDGQAECSCKHWHMICTGYRLKKEIQVEFNKHLKNYLGIKKCQNHSKISQKN